MRKEKKELIPTESSASVIDCLRCPLCDGYFGRHGFGMCQQSHCRAEQTNPSGIFFGASDFENRPEKIKKLGMN